MENSLCQMKYRENFSFFSFISLVYRSTHLILKEAKTAHTEAVFALMGYRINYVL